MWFPSLMFATSKAEVTEDLWTLLNFWDYTYQQERYSDDPAPHVSWYTTSYWWGWEWARTMLKFDLTWLPSVATQVILELSNATFYYTAWEIKAASCHPDNWVDNQRSWRNAWSYYRTALSISPVKFDITDIYNLWMSAALANNWIQIEPVNPNTVKYSQSTFTWAKLTITY